MADRPKYPDSTGSWDAPLPSRRAETGFIDRGEPIGRADRQSEATLDELMAMRRSAAEEPAPAGPAAPTSGPSWPGSGQAVANQAGPDPHLGDPELAAAAGIDGRGDPYAGRSTPSESMPRQTGAPMTGRMEPTHHNPLPPLATPGIEEPTQLHNPVQHQQHQQHQHHQQGSGQPRRYPEQVADGVYRRNRPGLGVILAIVTVAMIGMVAMMLVSQVTADAPLNPSAVVSATFALAGLPLAAWGLYPLLGKGSQSGPDHYGALLRAPYVYLLTGLTLLLAAGLAA